MAETKKDYITDLSYLNFNGEVDYAYFNGEAVMMFYNGLKVFNRAEYTLTVNEPLVDAEGIKDLSETLLLDSFKKNYGEEKEDVPFIVEPNEIPPNKTEEQRTGKFKVTQSVSLFEIEIEYTQREDRIVGYKIYNVTVRDPMYMQAAASGGVWIPFSISYTGQKLEVWASGKEGKTESWGGSVNSTQQSYIEQVIGRGMNGGTFDDSNGAVYAPYLGTTPTPYQEIAEITYIRFVDIGGNTREWSGHVYAWQEENEKSEYDRKYDISSKFDFNNRTINGESVTLEVQVSAYVVIYYEWSSGADGGSSTENASVFISANVGTINTSAASGYERVTWSIPRNQSGSSRTLTLRVYNSNAGYDVTYKVYQSPYVAPVVWSTPTLNGNVSVVIPASGNRTLFKIPVRQTKTENGQLFPYEWEAMVTQVQGHAVESSNASFSEGYLSCESLGKRWLEEGREVFYAERVWVMGKDGEEREVELNEDIIIRQAKNVRKEDDRSYDISTKFDFDGRTIDGDTSTLYVEVVSTSVYVTYTWSSGEPDSETLSTSVFLTANVGQLSTSAETARNSVSWNIPRNTGSSQRTLTLRVYNTEAGYDVTYKVYQSAYVAPATWSTPVLNGAVTTVIPASGSSVLFQIPVRQSKTENGSTNHYEWNATVTKVQGHAVESSGASFSNGYLSCNSLGANVMANGREAYYAERIWILGKDNREHEIELSGYIVIRQAANVIVKYARTSYTVNIVANPTSVSVTGGSSVLTCNAIETVGYYYSSNPNVVGSSRSLSMYGNLVASVGIFSNGTNKAQIIGTGKQETLKLDENIGAARTSTVTMTAVSTVDLPSIVVSCNVSQIAATYVWGEPSLAEDVPSSGGTITFTIVSKLNGHYCPITQVVTSLSGATIAEQPTLIDSSRGEYRFKVSVPENTSTQDRTFTVTATQFGSSDTKVWNVTQRKKSSTTKVARLMAGFSFNGTDYSKVVVTNARLIATGSDYGGGLVENLSLRVVNKKTAAIYGESGNLGNFNVPNNGSVSVPITSLPNSSNSNNDVGVEVWFGNPSRYQQTFDIMQLETDK